MYPKLGNKSQIVASQDFISNFVIGVCSKSNHKLTSNKNFFLGISKYLKEEVLANYSISI